MQRPDSTIVSRLDQPVYEIEERTSRQQLQTWLGGIARDPAAVQAVGIRVPNIPATFNGPAAADETAAATPHLITDRDTGLLLGMALCMDRARARRHRWDGAKKDTMRGSYIAAWTSEELDPFLVHLSSTIRYLGAQAITRGEAAFTLISTRDKGIKALDFALTRAHYELKETGRFDAAPILNSGNERTIWPKDIKSHLYIMSTPPPVPLKATEISPFQVDKNGVPLRWTGGEFPAVQLPLRTPGESP